MEKLATINHCKACPHAAYRNNEGYTIPHTIGSHARVYVYCGFNKRPFDKGQDVFGPQGIPDWCPLPDAPAKDA